RREGRRQKAGQRGARGDQAAPGRRRPARSRRDGAVRSGGSGGVTRGRGGDEGAGARHERCTDHVGGDDVESRRQRLPLSCRFSSASSSAKARSSWACSAGSRASNSLSALAPLSTRTASAGGADSGGKSPIFRFNAM